MDNSKITDGNNTGGSAVACRVAYMLDNEQPVLCTLIGDQPLFYADEVEVDFDEDAMMEESDSDLLFRLTQNDLQERARKFNDQKQQFIDSHKGDIEEKFAENTKSLGCVSEKLTAKSITDVIEKSRFGRETLKFVSAKGAEIIITNEIDGVSYDRNEGKIFVNAQLGLGVAVLGLAGELRRVWQHKQGALVNPLVFQPDDAIIINRAQAADMCVAQIRMAWELHLEGFDDAWEAVSASGLGDIAHIYVKDSRRDFRNLNNGYASQTAFEKWFLSDRCKLEDKKIIQAMLADHAGLIFDNEEASQMIGVDVISRLGEMPFGKNYLSNFATSIISDPLYTEVRDRSSANFLWFIKFESAFRDKEKDLKAVDNSDIKDRSIRTTLFEDLEEDGYYEEEGYGEVITFPGKRALCAKSRKVSAGRGAKSATIINFSKFND